MRLGAYLSTGTTLPPFRTVEFIVTARCKARGFGQLDRGFESRWRYGPRFSVLCCPV
jgi:hypothetical protein